MAKGLLPGDWLVLIAYLGGLVVYGWFFKRFIKTTEDYFIAGRVMPWWIVGTTLAAIALDAGDAQVPAGLSYNFGLAGLFIFVPACVSGSFILSMYLLPSLWRQGVITNASWLERRFNPAMRQWGAWLQMLQRTIVMSSAITGMAFLFQHVIGTEFWEGVLIAIAVSAFMTIVGGMFAVNATEIYTMFLGCVLGWTTFFMVASAMGWDVFWSKVWPEVRFVTFGRDIVAGLPNWLSLAGLFLICLPYGIINQEYVSKSLSAGSEWESRLGLMIPNVPLWVLWIAPFSLIGIMGRVVYPPGTFTGPADQVLFFFFRDVLPVGLMGFVVAAFVAGSADIGGTADTISSLFTIDFYRRYVKRDAPESHYVLIGRIATGVTMLIPLLWIPIMRAMPYVSLVYIIVTGALIGPVVIPYIFGPLSGYFSRWSGFIGAIVAGIYGLTISFGVRFFGWKLPAWMSHSWYMPFYTLTIALVVMVIVSAIENSVKGKIPTEELKDIVVFPQKVSAVEINKLLERRAMGSKLLTGNLPLIGGVKA
jgi:SSS family solute:Na+ symporter